MFLVQDISSAGKKSLSLLRQISYTCRIRHRFSKEVLSFLLWRITNYGVITLPYPFNPNSASASLPLFHTAGRGNYLLAPENQEIIRAGGKSRGKRDFAAIAPEFFGINCPPRLVGYDERRTGNARKVERRGFCKRIRIERGSAWCVLRTKPRSNCRDCLQQIDFAVAETVVRHLAGIFICSVILDCIQNFLRSHLRKSPQQHCYTARNKRRTHRS